MQSMHVYSVCPFGARCAPFAVDERVQELALDISMSCCLSSLIVCHVLWYLSSQFSQRHGRLQFSIEWRAVASSLRKFNLTTLPATLFFRWIYYAAGKWLNICSAKLKWMLRSYSWNYYGCFFSLHLNLVNYYFRWLNFFHFPLRCIFQNYVSMQLLAITNSLSNVFEKESILWKCVCMSNKIYFSLFHFHFQLLCKSFTALASFVIKNEHLVFPSFFFLLILFILLVLPFCRAL